jgi:hypothetical protein
MTSDRVSERMIGRRDIGVWTVSNRGFRLIDKTFLLGPVALFPKVALSWRVNSVIVFVTISTFQVVTPDDITEESVELFSLFEPKIGGCVYCTLCI